MSLFSLVHAAVIHHHNFTVLSLLILGNNE